MENINKDDHLRMFQEHLEDELLKLCNSLGVIDGGWMISPDLEEKWREIAPEYMADAVKEINSYPEVALAWAGYLGMGYARLWDKNWRKHSRDGYSKMLGSRGFDDMDEHIVRDILGHPLDSFESVKITGVLRSCAQCALGLIRKEGIQGQTEMAFLILARAIQVIYCVGVSMELKNLGYKYEKIG